MRKSRYIVAAGLMFMIISASWAVTNQAAPGTGWHNPIVKQGYCGSPIVESTPLSFKGELYLLENWRSGWACPKIGREKGGKKNEVWMAHLPEGPAHYDRREYIGRVLPDHALGTAIVWGDRVYVFATAESDNRRHVDMSYSDDMKNWSEPVEVFRSYAGRSSNYPQGQIFNTAVTRDPDGKMVFLWETNGFGRPFTMRFGRVEKPSDPWNPGIIKDAVYGKDKYTGGPALYYEGGWYYLLYLEALGRKWETRITRSRDLVNWQDAPEGRAFITFDYQKTDPRGAHETNASDVELCYHDGRTMLFFTGGNQRSFSDLQWATYEGTPRELLEHFFVEDQNREKR